MTLRQTAEDLWMDTLRKTREAAERIREHLRRSEQTPPTSPPPTGIPCE